MNILHVREIKYSTSDILIIIMSNSILQNNTSQYAEPPLTS
jgi:hypothetical protein